MTRRIAAAVLLAMLTLCLSACKKAQSSVDEQKAEKAYTVFFTGLNTSKFHALSLAESDTLQVEIVRDSGDIRLSIQGEDGYNAYTGNGLISCAFTVGIPKAGLYVVTVAGEKADGSVSVTVSK